MQNNKNQCRNAFNTEVEKFQVLNSFITTDNTQLLSPFWEIEQIHQPLLEPAVIVDNILFFGTN